MVGDANRSIQVLNISNVNAQGKTVLNDGKLLELIQKYPFLYNPRVKAYNDTDYTTWAWKNINAAFNRSYANDPNAAFSTYDLMNRWQVLKPLIQCLSKAYDLEAIPQSLRKSVVKISTELEDQSTSATVKPYNLSQNLLMQHICDIAQLPMEKRLALEREVLDLILTTELESKSSITLEENAWKDINHDTEEFLNDIGFKLVTQNTVMKHEKIYFPNYSNQHSIRTYGKTRKSCGWVPLRDAHQFIKPCKVRIKRINVEDYLPLAKIIKIDRIKESKTGHCSNPGSPGIFGI
ncbi:lethal hybrid rescue [Cochliomyia hominivorax]